jgi:hypothetical protein
MSPVGRDGYLNPRTSFELQEKALQKFSQDIPETYLSPTADYETAFNTSSFLSLLERLNKFNNDLLFLLRFELEPKIDRAFSTRMSFNLSLFCT